MSFLMQGNAAPPAHDTSLTNINLIFFGNSIIAGHVDATYNVTENLATLAPFSTNGATIHNVGVVARNMFTMENAMLAEDWDNPTDVTIPYYYHVDGVRNIVFFLETINQAGFINPGQETDEECFLHIPKMCALLRNQGYEVVIITPPVSGTSQTPQAQVDRIAYCNERCRNEWRTFADAIYDFAAEPEMLDPTDTTYFSADQVHLKDPANLIMAQRIIPVIQNMYQ